MPESVTTKDRVLTLLKELPDDSSYEEILREIAFERMVERGLADANAGRVTDHEKVGELIRAWET